MNQYTTINACEQIRTHANVTKHSIKGLFAAAGVAYSGWWRWRNGGLRPSLRALEKLLAVPAKASADTRGDAK